jgi:hypothetical protein
MVTHAEIGRNAPCPCGSGKKYKKCCGAPADTDIIPEEISVEINKDIAYLGLIGRRRRDFCQKFTEKKTGYLASTRQAQINRAAEKGKVITCQKGCRFCCCAYVEAWLQECEAIVYHLYQNPAKMAAFLQKYPTWRQKVHTGGDLYRQCRSSSATNQGTGEFDDKSRGDYYQQQIACPFLDEAGSCAIYEVRPYSCAALFSLTPTQYCQPGSAYEAEAYRAFNVEATRDNAFYYGEFSAPIIAFMPIAVHGLLTQGVRFLSTGGIPGLDNLAREFYSDPEVQATSRRISSTGKTN